MLQTLTPEIEGQLSEIGFDEDEIVIINYIHQFKGKELLGHIQESVRTYCFQRMMEEATRTWQQKQWSEEQVFDLVENYRKTKRL